MLTVMRPRSFFLVVAAGALVVACGSSEQMSATFSSNVGGAGGALGLGGAGASGPAGPSSQASSAASSSQASSAASSAQASSAASSSSGSGGMGGGCDDVNDCASAVQLTDINGDTGDDIRTLSGSTSQWVKVLVKDVAFTLSNTNESYTATLTSPPGLEFALFAYDGDASTPDCFAAPLIGSGSPQVISDAWPDGSGNDNRWITFEVRYVSGPACDASSTWTLVVEGYTGG
jgi:hypothetical protein